MRTVVFPRYPGVLSALGLLGTPLRQDYIRTCLQTGPDYDVAALAAAFSQVEDAAERWFNAENMAPEHRRIERLVDVRYPHQGYELQIPIASGRGLGLEDLSSVELAFQDLHKRLYGYALDASAVQVVNVRVAAIGTLPPLQLPELKTGVAEPRPYATRRVYIDDVTGYVDCPAFRRDALGVGATIVGPTVVDQLDSTIFLPPIWRARVDAIGNLIAERTEDNHAR
jgi:N-methylhydantoinase A